MKKIYAVYTQNYISALDGHEPGLDSIWTDIENARMYLRMKASEYDLPFKSVDNYSDGYDSFYITEVYADTPDLYNGFED